MFEKRKNVISRRVYSLEHSELLGHRNNLRYFRFYENWKQRMCIRRHKGVKITRV